MRRRLFNAAALLSLLLYALALAALVRSLWRSDQFMWLRLQDAPPSHYRWYTVVMSGRGGIELAQDAEVYDLAAAQQYRGLLLPDGWRYQGHSAGPPRYPRPAFNTRERARFGFWVKWHHTRSVVRREIILPYWFLAIVTGILPTAWLITRRRESLRRRRAAAGLCTRCGYDLRASSGMCPECGQVVAP